MKLQGIAAVVFDWYSTLAVPYDNDFWTRMPRIIEDAGGTASMEAIAEWNSIPIDHQEFSSSEQAYRDWQTERLLSLFQQCGVYESTRVALARSLNAIRYQRLFGIFSDVPETLAKLRSRGLRLGLCSNWDWDLDRHLHHNGIYDLFTTVVCSASVGFRKPHPRIFETLIQRMGVLPENILFVGDSWQDDIQGSTESGLRAVHIARSTCPVAEHAPVLCINDLENLLDIV